MEILISCQAGITAWSEKHLKKKQYLLASLGFTRVPPLTHEAS